MPVPILYHFRCNVSLVCWLSSLHRVAVDMFGLLDSNWAGVMSIHSAVLLLFVRKFIEQRKNQTLLCSTIQRNGSTFNVCMIMYGVGEPSTPLGSHYMYQHISVSPYKRVRRPIHIKKMQGLKLAEVCKWQFTVITSSLVCLFAYSKHPSAIIIGLDWYRLKCVHF